jgi:NlpC/P60 family putative phage cell wall peptidase
VTAADAERVIAATRSWLGTPYHDQASGKGVGCDCLGLVRGVWREVVGPEPLALPPYSRDWGETGPREPLAEAARRVMRELPVTALVLGALILFRMRTGAVAKHCGIVTAPDRFIHSYERLGVVEVPLDAAWQRRIAFAFLFPARQLQPVGFGTSPLAIRAETASCTAERLV